jgi:cytosine/adenosine deaminase-related metal-dependent hydrolase
MTVSLQARYVYPVDRPPIENGVVTIAGERIVSVGRRMEGQAVRDLGDLVLLPGLINAHTHLEFSHLDAPLGTPGMRLPDWIRLVIAERGRRDQRAEDAIAIGLNESLAAGVTAIGEVATASFASYSASAQTPRLALLAEVIGFSRARADSAFAAVEERLAKSASPKHVFPGISPHAPYTVSRPLLERLVQLARQGNLPVAMHLAESREELEFLERGSGPFQELLDERSMWDAAGMPRGAAPFDYLSLLGEAPCVLVIHGNYLGPRERKLLSDSSSRMSLVYCPRTHAYFQHEAYPLAALLADGVRVVLGTDSKASNPDLSLLAEMRYVLQNHAGISPERVLQMATLDAAVALRWDAEIGSLTAGKRADLVALSLDGATYSDSRTALESALLAEEGPVGVWLGGRELKPARSS